MELKQESAYAVILSEGENDQYNGYIISFYVNIKKYIFCKKETIISCQHALKTMTVRKQSEGNEMTPKLDEINKKLMSFRSHSYMGH